MKRIFNTAVVVLLLGAYLHLGVLGHLVQWTATDGWGQNGQQLERTRPSQPVLPKVCWTQPTHVSSVSKTSVPAPAVIPAVVPTSSDFVVCGFASTIERRASSTEALPQLARSPPSHHFFL